MEQSENTKVYRFDLSKYKKRHIKGIVINTIILILIYTIAAIFYIVLHEKMSSYVFLYFIPPFYIYNTIT